MTLSVFISFLMMFHKKGEPLSTSPLKFALITLGNRIVARIGILMNGCPFIQEKRVNLDYSAYLGPNWKRTFENTGTVICNHTVFTYILVHMYR